VVVSDMRAILSLENIIRSVVFTKRLR